MTLTRSALPARPAPLHRIPGNPVLRRLPALLLTLGLASASLPAHALFGDDDARKAILELRNRVEVMESGTSEKLDEIGRRLSAIETRLDALDQGQRANIQMQNAIEALREESARLRGQLDVMQNEMQRSTAAGAPGAEGALPLDAAAGTPSGNASTGNAPAGSTPAGTTPPSSETAKEPARKATDESSQAYEAALASFRAGKFKSAASAFKAFTQAHPDSALMPQALYWFGAAQYANGDFRAAITTLNQLAKDHPKDSHVADGLVIVGNAQSDNGDNAAARETFRRITERYPGTSAAGTAKQRLAGMR